MDWPKARAILLAAFTVVNLILAYSIWGPNSLPADLTDVQERQTPTQLRSTLIDRGLILPATVTIPRTPGPMQFLHIEWPSTPDYEQWNPEDSLTVNSHTPPGMEHLRPLVDPETKATVFRIEATGTAARDLKLDNREQVQRFVDDYLRQVALLPAGARYSGYFPRSEFGRAVVEYVPDYKGFPVYSGYVRAEVSTRGIESITRLWVVPTGYTPAQPKAIRPAGEALLRLAGRLNSNMRPRTVTDIQLGYYAGRALVPTQSGDVHGWDTVPVWRIVLDTGEVYFINAFNGEWES